MMPDVEQGQAIRSTYTFKFSTLIRTRVEFIHCVYLVSGTVLMPYIHTYILYWLVPTGLFRVNFTLQNYKPST